MTQPESRVLAETLIRLGSRPDVFIWRNNTGAYKDVTGRLVRYGLVGSADILGVLAPSGRLLAIECKTATGKQTDAQRRFQAAVLARGGIYILARSADDAEAQLAEVSQ